MTQVPRLLNCALYIRYMAKMTEIQSKQYRKQDFPTPEREYVYRGKAWYLTQMSMM